MQDSITINAGEFDFATIDRVCRMLREEACASDRLLAMTSPAQSEKAFWWRLHAREMRAIADRLQSINPSGE